MTAQLPRPAAAGLPRRGRLAGADAGSRLLRRDLAVDGGRASSRWSAGASRGEWGEAKGAAAQANTLRERVAPLAQRNVEAYAERGRPAAAATARADGRDDRTSGSLLERAAQIPLEIAEAAVDVASLAAVVAERGEQALRADAVAGALLAQGAARAAATLVEVNLGTTSSDPRVTRARDLAGSATAAAERALATLA